MKKNRMFLVLASVAVLVLASMASAHSPLFSCWDNGDGTLSCEGGFSDGSSAAGMEVRVQGKDGKEVLFSGKLDKFGELTFPKPSVPFVVIFDGGPGHSVEVQGESISK